MKPAILIATLLLLLPLGARGQGPTFFDKPWPFATLGPEYNDSVPDSLSKVVSLMQPALASAAANAGAPNWLPTKVVATTAGTAGLPIHATRRRVACVNNTGETIYIGPVSGVTSTTGYPVLSNTTIALSTTAAIYVTSASGTAVIWFVETYD